MTHCLKQLLFMLEDHCENDKKQKGKSDIEPIDYVEKTDRWYKQIIKIVEMKPPNDYVKAIEIFQDSLQNIIDINYVYCEVNDYPMMLSINIYWIS